MGDPKAVFARHVARIVAGGLTPERTRGLDALDLACGRGDVLLEVAGRLPAGSRIVGVSNDRAQLDQLHTRLGSTPPHHQIFPRHEEAEKLPFADQVFDKVWAGLASTHLEPLRPVLRQALRVLRPDGQLIIVALLRDTLMDLIRIAGQFMSDHEDSLRMRPLVLDHARALDKAGWEDAVRKSGGVGVDVSSHHFEMEVTAPIADDPVFNESIVPMWLGCDTATNRETLQYMSGFVKEPFILPITMVRVVCKRGEQAPEEAVS